MSIDISVNFTLREGLYNIPFEKIIEQFTLLVTEANKLLGKPYDWYETGYSKKQALLHVAFGYGEISEGTLSKWKKKYEKDSPLFVESIWDGLGDYSSAIDYRKMFVDQPNRANVELHLVSQDENLSANDFIELFSKLACHFDCSYINADSKGYRFFDKNVFPDRLSVGWMVYTPSIILPDLVPQAARVISVFDGIQRKGTIIVATNDIFDGSNKDHLAKANDLEIRLLDLGLLPLITEL